MEEFFVHESSYIEEGTEIGRGTKKRRETFSKIFPSAKPANLVSALYNRSGTVTSRGSLSHKAKRGERAQKSLHFRRGMV